MMILDTNVVSEIMRPQPDAGVLAWLNEQEPADLWLSAITAAELMAGVARLPEGKRRQQLMQAVAALLEQDFAGQILAFDLTAASVYADLVAQRERSGRPINMADAQIAAICLAHQAVLVTRNQKDFEGLGLAIVNPWTATPP